MWEEGDEIGDGVLGVDKGFVVVVDLMRVEVKGEFKIVI